MESTRLSVGRVGERRLFAGIALATATFLIGVSPTLASGKSFNPKPMSAAAIRKVARQDPNRGIPGPAARKALRRGYLVPHPHQYRIQKARAARRATAGQALSAPLTGPLAPSQIRNWEGLNDHTGTPPDETSAVGTGRYVQLINTKFGIYNKTGNIPISQGSLNSLVGASSTDNVFDPQIMWDATTKRFYYAADDIVSSTDNVLLYGFSKTATPSSAADWCQYGYDFGAPFPDFPKLGDSQYFAMIGSNVFASNSSNNYLGSDLLAVKKPPAGTSCPGIATFQERDKKVNGGFTPTPASEIDTNATGWAVARSSGLPATSLKLYKVTRSSTGVANINATPTSVAVPSYNMPPPVPQKGSTHKLDSADGRNTQAQAAVDPAHGNKFAIWTQHTVSGGAGAEVRWYEINPATASLIQKGKATSPSLYEFNGAITANRQVNGATKGGGNAMVMNFNTSSSTAFPSIKMVSKIGSSAQSGQVAVFNGTQPLGGFDCTFKPCRWGDYAAATPDPSTANRIWQTSQYGIGPASTSGPGTANTRNFVATP